MRNILVFLLFASFLPLSASLANPIFCPPDEPQSIFSVFPVSPSPVGPTESPQIDSQRLQKFLDLADRSMELAMEFSRQGRLFFDGPIEDENIHQHFSNAVQAGFSSEEAAALWMQARELLQASFLEWLEEQKSGSPIELQNQLQKSAFAGMIGDSELSALYAYLQAEPLIESILSDTVEDQVLYSEWHALLWERGRDGRLSRRRLSRDEESEKERLESERSQLRIRMEHSFDQLGRLNSSFGGINIDQIRRDAERERALARWRLWDEPLTRARFESTDLHDYFDSNELEATLVAMELKEIFQEAYAARYALGWLNAAPNPADRAMASEYSGEISKLDQRLRDLKAEFPEHVSLEEFYAPLGEVTRQGGEHRREQERENLEARLRGVFEALEFDEDQDNMLFELSSLMSSRGTRASNDEWLAAVGRALEDVQSYQSDLARNRGGDSQRVGVGNTGNMGMGGRGVRSVQERRGYQSLVQLLRDHGISESDEATRFLRLLRGSRLSSLSSEKRLELERALAPDVEPPSFWQRAVSTILQSEEALIESLANLTLGNALYYGGGVVGTAFGGGWEAGSEVGVQFILANQRAANEGHISGALNRVSPLRGVLASQLDQPHYGSIYGSTDDMASSSLWRLALSSNPLNPVGEVMNLALEAPAAAFSATQQRLMGLSDLEYSAHKRAGGFARYTEGAFDVGLGALSLAIMAKTGGASAMSRLAMAGRSVRVAGGMSLVGGVAAELRTTDEDFNWGRLAENTVRGTAGSMLFMGATSVMSNRMIRGGHTATTTRNVARSANIAQAQREILETLGELIESGVRLSDGEEIDTQDLIGLALQFGVGVYDVTDPSLGPVMARLRSQARAESTVSHFYEAHPDFSVSREQRKAEADSLLRVQRFVQESGIRLNETQLSQLLASTMQAHVQGRGTQNREGAYPRLENIRKSRILMEGYEAAGLSREQAAQLARFVLEEGIAGDTRADSTSEGLSLTRMEVSARAEAAAALEHLESQPDLARFGLEESYTPDQVKEAYRRLSRKWHPDVLGLEASADLIAIHQRGFHLVQQTYDRLNSNTARQVSVDQTTKPRAPRDVSAQQVDQYVQEHAARWRESILNFESQGISDAQVHRMLEALDFGREAEFANPAEFVQARERVLVDQAENLIDAVKDLRQLENVRMALQAVQWTRGEAMDSWRSAFDQKWEQLSDQADIASIHRYMNLWLSVDSWRSVGDSISGDLDILIHRVAQREGLPPQEVARQALASYIRDGTVGPLVNNPLAKELRKIWLEGGENQRSQMLAIREMILELPNHRDFHHFLFSTYRASAPGNSVIRNNLLEVFGAQFLIENGIEIGRFRSVLSRFQNSPMDQDLIAARRNQTVTEASEASRAEALMEASLQTDQAELRLGQVRLQLESAELRRVSRMSFNRAVRYLREQHGIEVVVLPKDHDAPELLAYHSYFAISGGVHAAFIPAHTNLQIGGYERKFSDRPVIVLKEEAKGSLTHEFAHFLLFEAVGRASESAGIPHQALEAYHRSSALGELMSQKESDLWASPFRAGARFSESDVSLYIDAALLAAQRDFQRLREEIFVDQMELRVRSLDPAVQQKKTEHLNFELERFEDNTQRLLVSLRKRLTRLAPYLSEAEVAQFNEAIQYLQSLVNNLDSAVLDMNYIGPMELILNREASEVSEVLALSAPAVGVDGNSVVADLLQEARFANVQQEARSVFERALPILEQQTTDAAPLSAMLQAVWEAHEVGRGELGRDGRPAGVIENSDGSLSDNWTPEQLRRKIEILREAGISSGRREQLIRQGVVGVALAEAGLTTWVDRLQSVRERWRDDLIEDVSFFEETRALLLERLLDSELRAMIESAPDDVINSLSSGRNPQLWIELAQSSDAIDSNYIFSQIRALQEGHLFSQDFHLNIENYSRIRSLPIVEGVERITNGSGGIGEIYLYRDASGQEFIVKTDRGLPHMRSEAEKIQALEPYGGPRFRGIVRMQDHRGVWREAVMMDKVEGVDLTSALYQLRRGEAIAIDLSEEHLQSLRQLEQQLRENDQHVWETNPGDFMLTPDGRVVALDLGLADGDSGLPNRGLYLAGNQSIEAFLREAISLQEGHIQADQLTADLLQEARFANVQQEAQLVFRRALPILQRQASEATDLRAMLQAVWEAHEVGRGELGRDGRPAGVIENSDGSLSDNWTPEQLRRKIEILREAGILSEAREELVRSGVVGARRLSFDSPLRAIESDSVSAMLQNIHENVSSRPPDGLSPQFERVALDGEQARGLRHDRWVLSQYSQLARISPESLEGTGYEYLRENPLSNESFPRSSRAIQARQEATSGRRVFGNLALDSPDVYVVYHGTQTGDSSFERGIQLSMGGSEFGRGFYTATDIETARRGGGRFMSDYEDVNLFAIVIRRELIDEIYRSGSVLSFPFYHEVLDDPFFNSFTNANSNHYYSGPRLVGFDSPPVANDFGIDIVSGPIRGRMGGSSSIGLRMQVMFGDTPRMRELLSNPDNIGIYRIEP